MVETPKEEAIAPQVLQVTFRKDTQNYRARVMINGTSVKLGSFRTLEEAKQARLIAVNKAFGEFTSSAEKL